MKQHTVEVPCDLANGQAHVVEVVLDGDRVKRLRSTCPRATVDRLGGRSCRGLVEKARRVMAGFTSETEDLGDFADAIGIDMVRSVLVNTIQTRERRRPYHQPSFVEQALATCVERRLPLATVHVGVEVDQITVVALTPPSYRYCVLRPFFTDGDRALANLVHQLVPWRILVAAMRWRGRTLPADLDMRVHMILGTEHRPWTAATL